MGQYRVICPTCGTEYTGYALGCACNTLLRTEYSSDLQLRSLPGIWRFLDWLPCTNPLDTKAGSITYKSEGLGQELGLSNLYISFTGYWPEKEAYNLTCSFKDLEANPTVSRAKDVGVKALAIASAGNTARAFAHIANQTGFDVYLLVPETCLGSLWTPEPPTEHIHLYSVPGDYCRTIELTRAFCKTHNIQPEGGARNVARRDGMGTVMLDGAHVMKRIPDHYFQAIGSGTGAISCWEMAKRLQKLGWSGQLKLHVSQNAPFVPIHNAWQAKRSQILSEDMENAEESIKQIHAVVLSNRTPPYSIGGGMYEALMDSNGSTYSVTNQEAHSANQLFESIEGIDIVPAAQVAVASLCQAIDKGIVDKDDYVLLNVTGGGLKRLKEDFKLYQITPEGNIKDSSGQIE
jgi:cysteate synthase